MLGDRVKAARDVLGISQAELARRTLISQGTISLIEANKRPNPGLGVLRRLAAGLELTLDALDAPRSPGDALDRALAELRARGERPALMRLLEGDAARLTDAVYRAEVLAAVLERIEAVRSRPQRRRQSQGGQHPAPEGVVAEPHPGPTFASYGRSGAGEQVDCAG